jgi:hypothetical protein
MVSVNGGIMVRNDQLADTQAAILLPFGIPETIAQGIFVAQVQSDGKLSVME